MFKKNKVFLCRNKQKKREIKVTVFKTPIIAL